MRFLSYLFAVKLEGNDRYVASVVLAMLIAGLVLLLKETIRARNVRQLREAQRPRVPFFGSTDAQRRDKGARADCETRPRSEAA